MVRKYAETPGSRNYRNYTKDDLEKAVDAVRNGISKRRAAKLHKKYFRPTILSQQEQQVIADTLGHVANWGFPLTKVDVHTVVKKYLDKQGRVVSVFKDIYPGEDFVDNSVKKKQPLSADGHKHKAGAIIRGPSLCVVIFCKM